MIHGNNKTLRSLAVMVLVSTMALGCSSSGDVVEDDGVDIDERPERARYDNLSTEGLTVERADLDGTGEADQWTFLDDDGEVVRVERDMNFDGRVDLWEYYEGGELVEEEMSLDSAKQIDAVIFYTDGVIRRQQMASGFDGTFAIEKFYDSDRQLRRVERDTSNDGQVDTWDYYDDGQRVRIGWDTIGDGQPDRFQEY